MEGEGCPFDYREVGFTYGVLILAPLNRRPSPPSRGVSQGFWLAAKEVPAWVSAEVSF